MNITRHNYEEFFLLLADGELSPAQEEAVLQFTKQHPDLAEELELMMDCRLLAEVPPIFPKEKILKPVLWNVDEPDEMQIQLLNLLDNELGERERILLEEKIAADKLLKLEWETLLAAAKLEATPVPAFPKEKLLKPTIWNVDQPDTIYVQMMALLDNELSATEKLELQQKMLADKALQIEWQSLQKTLLEAEAIVFPNKESLYRQKEQRRIGGWIRRAAAAAVIMGFGWYLWPKADNTIPSGNIATKTTKKNNPGTVQPSIKAVKNPATNPGDIATKQVSKNGADDKRNRIESATQNKNKQNTNVNNPGKNNMAALQANSNAENDASNNKANIIASAYNAGEEREQPILLERNVITSGEGNHNEVALMQPKQLSSVPANLQQNKNALLRTASYTEDDTDNDSDDDVIYIGGARLNKQKVRGVFRGITRSLGRTFSKSKILPNNETPTLSRSSEP